jgi:hypothetical protein
MLCFSNGLPSRDRQGAFTQVFFSQTLTFGATGPDVVPARCNRSYTRMERPRIVAPRVSKGTASQTPQA